MQGFLVRGRFRTERTWTKFAKEVAAATPDAAIEYTLSDLGSKHGVRRSYVEIKDVVPVPSDQIHDPVVRYRVEAKE